MKMPFSFFRSIIFLSIILISCADSNEKNENETKFTKDTLSVNDENKKIEEKSNIGLSKETESKIDSSSGDLKENFTQNLKIGMTKEFSGSLYSYYQFEGDRFFTLIDENKKETEFYFNAASCHLDGDPYYLECDIDDKLIEKIESLEYNKKSNIKVKVLGKYTYGWFCGTCDNCTKNKQKIWRPIRVIEIK